MKRLAVLSSAVATAGVAAIAISLAFGAGGAHAATTNAGTANTAANAHATAPHLMGVFKGKDLAAAGTAGTNNLVYNGGPVETSPKVYIDYWGSQWYNGFSTGGYSSKTAQTYIQDFFGNVGGSSWDGTNTQYCQGVAVGTINCGSSGTHITNPTGQLKGTWNDTGTSVPSSPTQSQIAAEATRAVAHFGYSASATYFVFTPSGHSMSGFGTQWCAWHDSTSSSYGTVAYAYMPYIPSAGASCGENFVNGSNNSFGNGYFDGFSIVGGHEYAEAMTDAHPSSTYAWIDSSGNETGDKCAWSSASNNITLGSHYYAVQPLWSNNISGCAM